ncbi:putative ribonuclease H-like domain-containing protein [Tanacetum coccineum]
MHRFTKTSKGYYAVPPPYTGNFVPPKSDLVLANEDEYVFSELVTSIPDVATSEAKTSESKPKSVGEPLIEDWISDSEVENESESKSKQIKSSFSKVKFAKSNEHVKTPKESVKKVENNKQAKYPRKNSQSPRGTGLETSPSSQIMKEIDGLLDENHVLLRVPRKDNMYSVNLKNIVPSGGYNLSLAKASLQLDESNLWHRRLGHINFKTMNKLVRGNLVRGLPSKIFENNHTCVACQKGKQHKASCKTKTVSSISQPLQMLHMDLFGPTFVKSLMKKMYCLVVTDDYSRFSWVFFLATKDETSEILKTFITGIENLIDLKVKVIRCDNGTEFKNKVMNQFCEMKGIKREFSVARTPQQNGVAREKGEKENKKTPLIEACKFDGKADEWFFVRYSTNSKAFRVPKKTLMQPVTAGNQTNKNAGIKDNVDAVPTQQYILLPLLYDSPKSLEDAVADDAGKKTNEKPANKGERNGQQKEGGALNKEDDQNVQDFIVALDNLLVQQKEGYANSTNRDRIVSPSVSAVGQSFTNADDLPTDPRMLDLEDTANLLNTGIFSGAYDDDDVGAEADLNNLETTMNVSHIPTTRIHKDHPKDQIIGDINSATQTRRMTKISEEHAMVSYIKKQRRTNHKDYQNCLVTCFLSQIEPKKVTQALTDPSWIEAMQDELLQFSLQKVWRLVDLPKGKHAIGTKWVYRNKKDERRIVVRNKARLVAQEKALYGLHQAPRAWYETLSAYLLENGFRRGLIDKTLFIKKSKGDILLVQMYVDDIIFGSTQKSLCIEFEGLMHKKFQMSSMGELTFFLGLQVMQRDDGIFISQDKYVSDILKKFDFSSVKTASTPIETNKALLKEEEADDVDVHLYKSMIGSLMYLTASRPDIMFVVCACARFQVTPKTSHLHAVKRIFRYLKGQPKLGLWYPKDSPFDLEAFSDSDYAGASLDKKSTTGGCQFLGKRLISWQCKKQTIVANSTTEALLLIVMDRTEENAEFHQIVDFLTTSSIHYALTVSPTIYASYIEQFWNTANSQTVNDVKQIHATVDGKTVVISESSVRSDLHFNDEDGITCLTNTAIFENLALMGYESDSDKLTFQKALFSPQWKYLIHTILHCLSSKSTSWNEFSTNIASAVICLATGQKFNFSKLIFDGMLRNLDTNTKKFSMYPRFLQLFLNNQISLTEPFNDTYETPKPTINVFTNMKRKGKDFSGRVTPLFASMLAPPVVGGEADEAIFKEKDDRVVRATTTAASLDAVQANGDRPRCQEAMRGAIAQTRSERAYKHSYDSPLPGVNTPKSNEEMNEQQDLMEFVPPTPHN